MRNVDWGGGFPDRVRPFLVLAVVLLLTGNVVALAAHDGGSSVPSAASVVSGAVEKAPGATGEAAPPPTTSPGAIPSDTGSTASGGKSSSSTTMATPTTSTTFPTPTTLPGGYVYEVTLVPTCVAVGQEFTITFHLKPWAGAVLLAIYADGENHDTKYGGFAKEDGLIVYTWKAPPVPGEGIVYTQAHDPEHNRKGDTNIEFRIVEVLGMC